VDAFEELCAINQVFEPTVSSEVERRVGDAEAKQPC
jgi:hypothetical protein